MLSEYRKYREEEVLLMLGYYREYRTLEHIGFDYGVSETTALRIVKEIENVLIKSGKFSLSKKKELYESGSDTEYILVDVTEIEVQKPKKKQKYYYSGKNKKYTIKAQIVVNQDLKIKVDLGYSRISKMYKNAEIPKKKSKNNPLSKEDKIANKEKSSSRIYVEHINAKIKVFQIFTQKYRNRRKRLELRLNLICGLINFERST